MSEEKTDFFRFAITQKRGQFGHRAGVHNFNEIQKSVRINRNSARFSSILIEEA